MRPFTAHTDGKVLVPDEPVELRPGARYRVSLEPLEEGDEDTESLRDFLLRWAGTMEGDLPPDLAKNHDHYLHGRPKR